MWHLLFLVNLFLLLTHGYCTVNLREEFEKLRSKPADVAYENLLARVDVGNELFVEMILHYWDQTGSPPEKLWPCTTRLNNQILDDNPFDVLKVPIYNAFTYKPQWEVLPKPEIGRAHV